MLPTFSMFFILLCLTILLLVLRRHFMYVNVIGGSMHPCLQHKDRVLAVRRFKTHKLKVGQIVICDTKLLQVQPELPSEFGLVVKRIIALPQTEVRFDAQEGERTMLVPPEHLFLQGDAVGSIDSRSWGPAPISTIVGIAVLRMPRMKESDAENTSSSDFVVRRLDIETCSNDDLHPEAETKPKERNRLDLKL